MNIGPLSDVPPTLIMVPLIFGLVGTIFFVLGVRQLVATRAFARTVGRALGVVIGFNRRRGHYRSGYLDFPVVRYQPPGLGTIEFESPQGTSPRLHREGQVVTVLYDTTEPQRAQIQSGCLQYALPLIFTFLGGTFVVIALVVAAVAWFVARLPTS